MNAPIAASALSRVLPQAFAAAAAAADVSKFSAQISFSRMPKNVEKMPVRIPFARQLCYDRIGGEPEQNENGVFWETIVLSITTAFLLYIEISLLLLMNEDLI